MKIQAAFATPTMARLYLAQGHFEEAREISNKLAQGGHPVRDVDDALRKSDDARVKVLTSLLARVRERRRLPSSSRG